MVILSRNCEYRGYLRGLNNLSKNKKGSDSTLLKWYDCYGSLVHTSVKLDLYNYDGYLTNCDGDEVILKKKSWQNI